MSFSMTGRPYDTGVRNSIEKLEANYDKDSKEIVLTWNYNASDIKNNEKVFFLIYRSVGNGNLERYTSIPLAADTDSFVFRDTDFSSKGIYNYSVKVVTDKGAESELSPKMVAVVE